MQVATLSACLIVKNESVLLSRCLESIRPFVDEIIVVDTGSSDNTEEIARSYGSEVYHFEWGDDFSAARNESLSHAGGDWILYIDADESIDQVNAAKIRQIITPGNVNHRDNVMAVMVRQCIPQRKDNIANAYYSEYCRIFRSHPSIRFEGAIHEQILPAIERLGGRVFRSDIVIHHWAYAVDEDKKRRRAERNLRFLLVELQQSPGDPFVHFNLGVAYRELGQRDLAVGSFHRALQCDDNRIRRELVGQIHLNLAKLYLEAGDNERAVHHAKQVVVFDPANPLSAYLLATIAVTKNQYADAMGYLETAIQITKGEVGVLPTVELNLAQVYLELGSCCYASGDFLKAEQCFTHSLEYNPKFALPYLLLGNCRFRRGDRTGARKMYESALALDPSLNNAQQGIVLCSS